MQNANWRTERTLRQCRMQNLSVQFKVLPIQAENSALNSGQESFESKPTAQLRSPKQMSWIKNGESTHTHTHTHRRWGKLYGTQENQDKARHTYDNSVCVFAQCKRKTKAARQIHRQPESVLHKCILYSPKDVRGGRHRTVGVAAGQKHWALLFLFVTFSHFVDISGRAPKCTQRNASGIGCLLMKVLR